VLWRYSQRKNWEKKTLKEEIVEGARFEDLEVVLVIWIWQENMKNGTASDEVVRNK
jgi:hypothetical protein